MPAGELMTQRSRVQSLPATKVTSTFDDGVGGVAEAFADHLGEETVSFGLAEVLATSGP